MDGILSNTEARAIHLMARGYPPTSVAHILEITPQILVKWSHESDVLKRIEQFRKDMETRGSGFAFF